MVQLCERICASERVLSGVPERPGGQLNGSGGVPNAPGQAHSSAADASGGPGVGVSALQVTSLGTPATPTGSTWHPFKLSFDQTTHHLFASIGDATIYDGDIPEGNFNRSGGVTVGFRENIGDGLQGGEGTYVDNITVNAENELKCRGQKLLSLLVVGALSGGSRCART